MVAPPILPDQVSGDSSPRPSCPKFQFLWTVVSYISVPQLSAAYFFIAISGWPPKQTNALLVSLIFAAVIPLLSLVAIVGFLHLDPNVPRRSERVPIYLVSIASYVVGASVLLAMDAPIFVSALMLAYVLNTVLAVLVTAWFEKVSAHVWGIFGPAIVVLFALGSVAYLIAALGGVATAVSRIELGHHTVTQVLLTILLASVTTVAVVIGFELLT